MIGVDASAGMLAVAAEQLELGGVTGLVSLRLGDLRDPPIDGEFPLVVVPFRTLLHMETDHDHRRSAPSAVPALLGPDGRFIFDVFTPSEEDIAETHGRWLRAGGRNLGAGRLEDRGENADPPRPWRGWASRR